MTTRKRRSKKALTWHVKHAMQKVALAMQLSAVLRAHASDQGEVNEALVRQISNAPLEGDDGGDEIQAYIEMIAERED